MNLEELKAERAKVQEAINNILEAGQEYQTRSGRVKFANLDKLYDRLSYLDNAIVAAESNNNCNVVLQQFGGFD